MAEIAFSFKFPIESNLTRAFNAPGVRGFKMSYWIVYHVGRKSAIAVCVARFVKFATQEKKRDVAKEYPNLTGLCKVVLFYWNMFRNFQVWCNK